MTKQSQSPQGSGDAGHTAAAVRSRLSICLIAGAQAAERFPSLVHYLQLGLIDECVDTLRVVIQGEPLSTLLTGTTVLLQERPLAWPLSGWSQRAFIQSVARKVESMQRNGPTIVHAFSASALAPAVQIAEATQSDLVVTLSAPSEFAGSAARKLLEKAAAFIFPAGGMRDVLPSSLRVNRRLEQIAVGVSCGERPVAFESTQRAPVIVHSGPLTDDCGVDCLLRATRQILAKVPSLLVFVIGKGPAEESLRRLSESLQIDQSVTFTGRIDDWRGVLEASDIFCAPGSAPVWREEPLCALAAGVCVVASKSSPCEELIDGRTCLRFEDDDDAALAHGLLKLLGERDFALQLASTGQEHVRQNNSPSRMIAAHLELYRALASRHQTLSFESAR